MQEESACANNTMTLVADSGSRTVGKALNIYYDSF